MKRLRLYDYCFVVCFSFFNGCIAAMNIVLLIAPLNYEPSWFKCILHMFFTVTLGLAVWWFGGKREPTRQRHRR